MADSPTSRKRKRKKCEHCGDRVSLSTYYRHREQFFDPVRQQWDIERQGQPAADSSSDENEAFPDVFHGTVYSFTKFSCTWL